MYAVVEVGGRQWKVQPGTRLDVNRLATEVGKPHLVDRVLLAQDGQQIQVGRPYLQGAKVVCEVVEHRLGPKTISYHFRRRENWRKTVGHRQPLTRLLVKEIQVGETTARVEAPASKPAKPPAAGRSEPARAPKAHAPRAAAKPADKPKPKSSPKGSTKKSAS